MIPETWRRTQFGCYGHMIDLVPVAWLARLRNPTPSDHTDLSPGGEVVGLAAFWERLRAEGMRDPVLLRVCQVTGWGRVEAGNHRVLLGERHGLAALPATVIIGVGAVCHPGNGDHRFDLRADLRIPLKPVTEVYEWGAAPSAVFRSLRAAP